MALPFRNPFRKKLAEPHRKVEIPADTVGTAALPGDLEAIRSRIDELLARPLDLVADTGILADMAISLDAGAEAEAVVEACEAAPMRPSLPYGGAPRSGTSEADSRESFGSAPGGRAASAARGGTAAAYGAAPAARGGTGAVRKASPAVRGGVPADLTSRLTRLDAGFSQTVLALIDARGATDAQIYRRANLTRQHFAKIRKDPRYRPTKKTALALAVALELDLDETLDLIGRAGYTLSHASRFDIIVEYFVMRGVFDIGLINETLYEFDQPLLGS